MEIAMPSQRELIKSDFVRHLMFSEISEFLFLTDTNSCYCLIHNLIPKKELLSISDERFFFYLRKWQWRSQSNEILSSLEETNVDKLGTTYEKCRISEKWNCTCERQARCVTREGFQEAKYNLLTVSRVYGIVVTVVKPVVTHSVVNFTGSHNCYLCNDFLTKETLWS